MEKIEFRTTDHYSSYVFSLLFIAFGGSMFVLGVLDLITIVGDRFSFLAFGGVFSLLGLFLLIMFMRKPTQISIEEDGRIRLKSPIRKVEIALSEIVGIHEGENSLTLKTAAGKYDLYGDYADFSFFLKWLKRHNPQINIPSTLMKKKFSKSVSENFISSNLFLFIFIALAGLVLGKDYLVQLEKDRDQIWLRPVNLIIELLSSFYPLSLFVVMVPLLLWWYKRRKT